MNIAEYSISKKTVTLTLAAVVVITGIISYLKLPRLEDPEFTLKQAQIITDYPGASAQEVAEEVTDKIEKAVQQMGQLKRVESRSTRNQSIVTVHIKDNYNKKTMPQVWDELRRKITDVQAQLPPGAGKSVVYDDFGDVYGMYFAIYGDGYSYAELKQIAKYLQRELLHVKDVRRISFWGIQDEAVYVEMSREKMAASGISPARIYSLLSQKNLVADAGKARIGPVYSPIVTTGGITSFKELENLLISKDGDRQIFLKDVAEVKRGYVDPPVNIMRYNGKPAVGIAASTVLGGNAMVMGDALLKRIAELKSELPLGIEIAPISQQSETVKTATNGFVRNVIESVVIITLLMLMFMGLRSGILISAVLIITVSITMMVMKFYDITLERISLGALVIALGMLVDDAIVVTEGMMVRIHSGEDKIKAAREVIAQNMWPLLGATAVSVLAFGSIGLSQSPSGEFCGGLFYVILISLSASWLTALTVTPIFCYYAFDKKVTNDEHHRHDPYGARGFRIYRRALEYCLGHRLATCLLMLVLLILSIYGFQFIPDSFFPNSTRNQFLVEIWLPEGSHIDETAKAAAKVDAFVKKQPHVTDTISFIGGGATRFILTYPPEMNDSAYALLLVSVDDWRNIDKLSQNIQQGCLSFADNFSLTAKKFRLGPGEGGRIQVRFSSKDNNELRKLADAAMTIMRADSNAKGIHTNWREKVMTIKTPLAEVQAKRLGITHQELSSAVQEWFSGISIGVFREGDELLPIIARGPAEYRTDIRNLDNIFVWSDLAQKMIPFGQLVNERQTCWENPIIMRRHRLPTITVHCDVQKGEPSKLLAKLKPQIDAIPLPPGCSREWGGDYEESNEAQSDLMGTIPAFAVAMILMVVFLFNSLRHTLIIWMTVPLTIIGVASGLLLFHQPFSFMALLGFLSLSGMQIRNAVVLLNEINCELAAGKPTREALMDSAVSRIRPVSMAAFSTVLGMLPLLSDAFFIDMAITIMFGLSFASVLTLFVIPVWYAIIFRVKTQG